MKSLDPIMIFGFGVLLSVIILAVIIALGEVKQESSFGLEIVLGCLSALAGGFAQWAFSKTKDE